MGIASASNYHDFNQLTRLKTAARADQDKALEEVASQFESIFVNMMLKSMREANIGGGIGDSSQTQFYQQMFDQQISVDMSAKGGIGIAEAIKRQLSGARPVSGQSNGSLFSATAKIPFVSSSDNQSPVKLDKPHDEIAIKTGEKISSFNSPDEFINKLLPYAKKAADSLGLPAEALIAQAALETGWGKHMMQQPSGDNAYNLFGIKADKRWQGQQVKMSTLEYEQGVAVKKRESFRAYDSWQNGFNDYAKFISENPRYEKAMKKVHDPSAYFDELQKAGYATDPAYSSKIKRILNSGVMNNVRTSLNQQTQKPQTVEGRKVG